MTLNQLRTFHEVARAGSIQGAADALVVTPPTVSAAVATLRDELGVDLVERDGRGIRLTAAGSELARYAALILGLVDRGVRAVREAAGRPGHLRLVAVTTAGEYVVPPLLARFRRSHPDVQVSLEVGNRSQVFDRLAAHEADLGIGGRPLHGDITGEAVLPNRLVVVAPPDHPLAAETEAQPSDLSAETWLLREAGSGTRETTEEFLRDHGIEPASALTIGSNGAIREAAVAGLGLTLTSIHAVGHDLAEGRLARLVVRDTPLDRPWHVLYAEDRTLPPAAAAFLDLVRSPEAQQALDEAGVPA